jgi:hypothetical protein
LTAKQYRAALDRLGLSQQEAARLFGADPRTSRRWALDEAPVPETVAMILRYMLKAGVSPADFEAASQ